MARLDNYPLDNLTFSGCHTHSGSVGDGAKILSSSARGVGINSNAIYITLLPFLPASYGGTGGQGNTVGTQFHNGARRFSDGNPASLAWNVDFHSGSWNISTIRTIGTGQSSKVNITVGGSLIGIDNQRNATDVDNSLSGASTFFLSSSGAYVAKFSSSDGNITYNHIEFRRLSA